MAYNIDLYGVGYSTNRTALPDTKERLFYMGALDGNATLILADYITPTPAHNVYVGGTSEALVTYLNNRTNDIVWLRLNHDASVTYQESGENELYVVRFDPTSAPPWNGDAACLPFLDLTIFVPPTGTVIMVR